MALISLEEAVTRLGVPLEQLEPWSAQGLLDIQAKTCPSSLPSGLHGLLRTERYIEEDQLTDVVESMGWLRLSADNWDGSDSRG